MQHSGDLILSVVGAIADHRGVDPVDLDPPLYAFVDPDALASLFRTEDESGTNRVRGSITFAYEDDLVRVTSTGEVRVSGGAPDDLPRGTGGETGVPADGRRS